MTGHVNLPPYQYAGARAMVILHERHLRMYHVMHPLRHELQLAQLLATAAS
jgi:hypothetical protein